MRGTGHLGAAPKGCAPTGSGRGKMNLSIGEESPQKKLRLQVASIVIGGREDRSGA